MKEAKKRDVAVYALTMLAMMAEVERDLISERTKEGLRAARAKGSQLGRPKGPGKSKLDKHSNEIIALIRNGSTKTFVAKRYGTTTGNLHNWLKKKAFPPSIFNKEA
jgi:DNA invertase Pin-like site-specific DNA recombinase